MGTKLRHLQQVDGIGGHNGSWNNLQTKRQTLYVLFHLKYEWSEIRIVIIRDLGNLGSGTEGYGMMDIKTQTGV